MTIWHLSEVGLNPTGSDSFMDNPPCGPLTAYSLPVAGEVRIRMADKMIRMRFNIGCSTDSKNSSFCPEMQKDGRIDVPDRNNIYILFIYLIINVGNKRV